MEEVKYEILIVALILALQLLAPSALNSDQIGGRCSCVIHIVDTTASLFNTFRVALHIRNTCYEKISVRDVAMVTIVLKTIDNETKILNPIYSANLPVDIEPGDSVVVVVNIQMPLDYILFFVEEYKLFINVVTTVGIYNVIYMSNSKYDFGPRFHITWRKFNVSFPLDITEAKLIVSNNSVEKILLNLRSFLRYRTRIVSVELDGISIPSTSLDIPINIYPYDERTIEINVSNLNIVFEEGKEYVVKICYESVITYNANYCIAEKISEIVFTNNSYRASV